MTSQELISIVANEIGDPGFEFVNKEEHLQVMNQTIQEVATITGAFFEPKIVNLVVDQTEYSFTDQDILKIVRLEYWYGGVATGTLFPCREIAFSRIQDRLNNADSAILYAPRTLPQQYEDGLGNVILTINREIPDENTYDYMSNWYSTQSNNGLITLYFGFKFKENDQLQLWYLSTSDKHEYFDDVDIIWDGYRNVVQEGMRWRTLRKMQFRPKLSKNQNYEYTKEYQASFQLYYKQYLPEIRKYITDLKTTQDVARIHPFNYP